MTIFREGIQAICHGWRHWICPEHRPFSAKPTVCLSAGYLQRNPYRTDYPTYLHRGWRIGSGVIESSCKSVVGRRLKGPGMRWRERGATALCQLRALYRSEPALWDSCWTKTLTT